MVQIWNQDAHCATDCSGGKSGAEEIGSRPEIRTQLNLINRNLQFITMTGKRLTMTDILVSARAGITEDLSSDLSSLKISSGANPYDLAHWGSERVVFLCAVFCAKSAQNTQKEKCRPLIGHWRPYAALSLVKSPIFAKCMQILTLLDVTLLGARTKMLIWGLWPLALAISSRNLVTKRLMCQNSVTMFAAEASSGDDNCRVMDTGERWGLRCEPRPRPRRGFMRRTFN